MPCGQLHNRSHHSALFFSEANLQYKQKALKLHMAHLIMTLKGLHYCPPQLLLWHEWSDAGFLTTSQGGIKMKLLAFSTVAAVPAYTCNAKRWVLVYHCPWKRHSCSSRQKKMHLFLKIWWWQNGNEGGMIQLGSEHEHHFTARLFCISTPGLVLFL